MTDVMEVVILALPGSVRSSGLGDYSVHVQSLDWVSSVDPG